MLTTNGNKMFNILRRHIISHSNHIIPTLEAQLQCGAITGRALAIAQGTIKRHSSNSSAYAGDGKTTVRVLNKEDTKLNLVDTYSSVGFRLHSNLFIYGSILLFPTNVFSWNVQRGIDITPDSLLLFDLIVPKTKIVIIGYGQLGEPYDSSIPHILKKKGISCEMLATPNAVTTYNYLVDDAVHVAGAFIPVRDPVTMTDRDLRALNPLTFDTECAEFPQSNAGNRVELDYDKKLYEKYVALDKEKKKFEE